MTSKNENVLTMALYKYQTKARNPRNSVAATNPVFDLKIENVLPMALMRIKQNLGTQAIR